MTDRDDSVLTHKQAHALIKLCTEVLPVWARQLASSRHQSELAVAEMSSAFAEIGPHLDKASRQSGQMPAALAQDADGTTQLAPDADTHVAAWLTRLKTQYVMFDQRHHHKPAPGEVAADDRTTFF